MRTEWGCELNRLAAKRVPKQTTLNRSRDKRLPTSQHLCLVNQLRIAPMAGLAILFWCLALFIVDWGCIGPHHLPAKVYIN